MFSSVDLDQILNHHDIRYRLDIVDSFLNVTDLCHNNTECTPNLVNFFLESEVSMLSPEIMAEVIDYIKSVSFFDKGRRFIFHPVAVFSIHKNKGRELKKTDYA